MPYYHLETQLGDGAVQMWLGEIWRVEETTDKGVILFSIHIAATDTAPTLFQRN